MTRKRHGTESDDGSESDYDNSDHTDNEVEYESDPWEPLKDEVMRRNLESKRKIL